MSEAGKIKRLTRKRIISRHHELYYLMWKRQAAQGKTITRSYNRSCSDRIELLKLEMPEIFG